MTPEEREKKFKEIKKRLSTLVPGDTLFEDINLLFSEMGRLEARLKRAEDVVGFYAQGDEDGWVAYATAWAAWIIICMCVWKWV